MPLSFVAISYIAGASTLALRTGGAASMSTIALLVVNTLILLYGLVLQKQTALEPFWVTYGSMLVAVLCVAIYVTVKYALLQQTPKDQNRPQLY